MFCIQVSKQRPLILGVVDQHSNTLGNSDSLVVESGVKALTRASQKT